MQRQMTLDFVILGVTVMKVQGNETNLKKLML